MNSIAIYIVGGAVGAVLGANAFDLGKLVSTDPAAPYIEYAKVEGAAFGGRRACFKAGIVTDRDVSGGFRRSFDLIMLMRKHGITRSAEDEVTRVSSAAQSDASRKPCDFRQMTSDETRAAGLWRGLNGSSAAD